MKKQKPRKNASLANVLSGIRLGKYYVSSINGDDYKPKFGFENMTVDIEAAEFDINTRWEVQTVKIPAKKRGNLSDYAGKKVEVIVTTIARTGARINFLIKEKK